MTDSLNDSMFGPYRLEGVLGRGGMGVVYRAYDTSKDREVALKLLPEDLSVDEGFRERFRREVEVVSRINEPHVIPITNHGEIDGRLFFEMALIEGVELAALLDRDRPLSPSRTVEIVSQLASALDTLHGRGLIHRDIKPANVLVSDSDGRDYVYLGDFGLSHAVGSLTTLPPTGTIIGTIAYMAPELFAGGPIDHRADIYALGCLLYECLTGQLPFPGGRLSEVMYGHSFLQPPRPSQLQPDLPTALDAVVARALAKNPEHRYPTAGTLARAARLAIEPSSTDPGAYAIDGLTSVSPRLRLWPSRRNPAGFQPESERRLRLNRRPSGTIDSYALIAYLIATTAAIVGVVTAVAALVNSFIALVVGLIAVGTGVIFEVIVSVRRQARSASFSESSIEDSELRSMILKLNEDQLRFDLTLASPDYYG